jgi:hypothetical protein|nr:MAG TPA: hypothetical protein [Caudoviricetes sp.]
MNNANICSTDAPYIYIGNLKNKYIKKNMSSNERRNIKGKASKECKSQNRYNNKSGRGGERESRGET